MDLKTIGILISFICLLTTETKAQTDDQKVNRAVFNQIEYFFNAGQPDSIYALANEGFQAQISKAQLGGILGQLSSLGKIKDASIYKFENGIAGYKAEFDAETLSIILGVDSNRRYHTLAFQPYKQPGSNAQETEPTKDSIISNVETKSDLDLFVDSVARKYAKQNAAQSLAVAVIHKNKINTFFYGETSKGNQVLPDANTLYEIGSLTKTFTASLLADMVNKGIVNLEDSIATYLPDSVAQNPFIQKITFKMLANHTSGLPRMAENYNQYPDYSPNNPYAGYERKDLFAFLKNYQNEAEPGNVYEYSNVAYGLLGELLVEIGKKPYMQLINELILGPLEMKSTTDQIDKKNTNIAIPHDGSGQQVPFWDFKALSAAGSLKSNLNDMLRYTIAQLTYPESSIQQAMNLTKQFTFNVNPTSDIGLAWHMNMIEGLIYYHHNGATKGSNTFVGFVPDEKSVVIILSNSDLGVQGIGIELIEKVLTTK